MRIPTVFKKEEHMSSSRSQSRGPGAADGSRVEKGKSKAANSPAEDRRVAKASRGGSGRDRGCLGQTAGGVNVGNAGTALFHGAMMVRFMKESTNYLKDGTSNVPKALQFFLCMAAVARVAHEAATLYMHTCSVPQYTRLTRLSSLPRRFRGGTLRTTSISK